MDQTASSDKSTKSKLAIEEGKILFIDDEPMVRTFAKRVLERNGYSVLLAKNGSEGLTIYGANNREISLVILDLNMPGMSGAQVLEDIARIRSDAKVIVSSGDYFAFDELPKKYYFLPKPYSPANLFEKVNEALGVK